MKSVELMAVLDAMDPRRGNGFDLPLATQLLRVVRQDRVELLSSGALVQVQVGRPRPPGQGGDMNDVMVMNEGAQGLMKRAGDVLVE